MSKKDAQNGLDFPFNMIGHDESDHVDEGPIQMEITRSPIKIPKSKRSRLYCSKRPCPINIFYLISFFPQPFNGHSK